MFASCPLHVNEPRARRKWKKLVIIAAVCIAAALAVVIPVSIENEKAERYKSAYEMINGDPLQAKTVFLSLGEYSDASRQAVECQNLFDYRAARALMDQGDIQGALANFISLGSYSDAHQLAIQCQQSLDYDDAMALMNAGDMQSALKEFIKLDDYSDAAQRAADCQLSLDYDAAVSLMSSNNFAVAYDAFVALGSYKDAASLAADCAHQRDYGLAKQYYAQGYYYSAYILYTSLGDYLDSPELAATCEQPMPKTGEIFRDPDYKNLKLNSGYGYDIVSFRAPKDGQYTFIKIYGLSFGPDSETEPIVTLAIAPGKKVNVKLPAGSSFHFKEAYGTVWYGEKERFGDAGMYFDMQFDDGDHTSSTVYMEITPYYDQYYVYTVKLRQKGVSEGRQVSREEF
jgi:tetratricopeptide (TPR) repeat protein